MKKILLTTFAILILPISFSYAEESATAGDLASATTGDKKALVGLPSPEEIAKFTDKQRMLAELRVLRDSKEKISVSGDEVAFAESPEKTPAILKVEHPELGIEQLYPDTPAPVLDSTTKQAITKASKWLHQTNTPVVRKGEIIQKFGAGVPTLVLPPLAISSIILSKGETVVPGGVQLADLENFGIEEAYGGYGRNKYPILIAKSKTLDEMQTVLIVITTKRIYHIKLVSSTGEWTPKLAFSYPSESIVRSPQTLERLLDTGSKTASEGAVTQPIDAYLYGAGDVQFNYKVKGDQSILPLRVFDLGHQTVIEMGPGINKVNAPALLLEDESGNEEMVNARFKNGRYILDQPIHVAYLLSGVGWDQTKVVIEKLEEN